MRNTVRRSYLQALVFQAACAALGRMLPGCASPCVCALYLASLEVSSKCISSTLICTTERLSSACFRHSALGRLRRALNTASADFSPACAVAQPSEISPGKDRLFPMAPTSFTGKAFLRWRSGVRLSRGVTHLAGLVRCFCPLGPPFA